MTTVDGIGTAVREVAERIGASVVGVAGRRSQGSGVVVAAGRVLTNAHNLWAEEVTVTFPDGRSEQGRALGVDAEGDLAVLEVDTRDAPAVAFRDEAIDLGDAVFGVANPGGRGLRVTFGTVSGTARSFRGPRGRRIEGSVEHTAPLLPGSSGGPVTDGGGRVIGINTHRLGEGFYLAIPAGDELRSRIEALGRGDAPQRRRLGVAVAPPEIARRLRRSVGLEPVDGLLVRGVEDDSPAAAAGLREGDVLTAAAGRDLRSADDLFAILESETGPVDFAVTRGAEAIGVTVRW